MQEARDASLVLDVQGVEQYLAGRGKGRHVAPRHDRSAGGFEGSAEQAQNVVPALPVDAVELRPACRGDPAEKPG